MHMTRELQREYLAVFQEIPWDAANRLSKVMSQFNSIDDVMANNVSVDMLKGLVIDIVAINDIIVKLESKLSTHKEQQYADECNSK